MSWIKLYGIALPHFRIEDTVLHPKGKKNVMKAICFSDEDAMTLAFEAASKIDEINIDGIFFASSTPVFENRYHASFLGDLLNLPQGILAIDFVNSARSGTDALLVANELIDSGKYKNILLIAVDVHFPSIGKELTIPFGHAACAILLSSDKGIAEISSANSFSSSYAEEFSYKGKYIQYDPRFSRETGFKANITSSLKKLGSDPKSFDVIILNSQYAAMGGGIFAKAGYEEKQFARDLLSSRIGNTGAVHALILLVNEIENQKKNILLVDYTNGANVLEIKNNSGGTTKMLQDEMNTFELVNSYQDYLLLRQAGKFDAAKYVTKEIFSSEIMQEREKDALLYMKGMKCSDCGTIYFLKTTRCKKCKGENFSSVQLQKSGSIYAMTSEFYFPTSFPPINMLVVDLENGGRMTVQQTDTMYPEKSKLQIGAKVKLVLRKMIENDMKPNYFWKAKIK